MRAAAVLLGAGQGTRLGSIAKSFLEVGGRPLLEHAVGTVDGCRDIHGFVVAAPPGMEARAEALAAASEKLLAVVSGGATRQESVASALSVVPEGFDAVVCHDVARPFARSELFSAVLEALVDADGAVPVLPVADTVKRVRDGEVAETLVRDDLALVQTPQGFLKEALVEAHRRARQEGFHGTDDAALLERAGFRVAVVAGDPLNVKVTGAGDLRLARAIAGDPGDG